MHDLQAQRRREVQGSTPRCPVGEDLIGPPVENVTVLVQSPADIHAAEPLSYLVLFLLFATVSRDRVHLSAQSCINEKKKKKNRRFQKRLGHTQAHARYEATIIRRSDQAALALADKATHLKDSERSLRGLWSRCLRRSPQILPGERALTGSPYGTNSKTVKQCRDKLQQPTLTGHSFHCTSFDPELAGCLSSLQEVYL